MTEPGREDVDLIARIMSAQKNSPSRTDRFEFAVACGTIAAKEIAALIKEGGGSRNTAGDAEANFQKHFRRIFWQSLQD